jgi:hypothetical protein
MVNLFLKIFTAGLISGIGMALALSSSNAGIVYAKPNTVAVVKLEVQNAKNVLFNRKGTTTFNLSNPFGKTLILGLPAGVKDTIDPEVYYSSIKPLEFKINVPKTAKAGIYPLKLEVEFYLCDTNIRVCYKETALAKAELRVGQTGSNTAIVMKLERGGLQIR